MTQHLDPRTLVELPDNPRYINDDDFECLCESIKRNPDFFELRPIVCSDRTGELVVIAGNQRLKAALHLGLATVPVGILSGLTVEREREIAVRDNVTNGEWDATKLESWADCDLVGWGVDIGFDTGDLPEFEREGDNSKTDYSNKNKEIDIDALDQTMVLKLYYSEDVYNSVKERLEAINPKLENALLNLLDNAS